MYKTLHRGSRLSGKVQTPSCEVPVKGKATNVLVSPLDERSGCPHATPASTTK